MFFPSGMSLRAIHAWKLQIVTTWGNGFHLSQIAQGKASCHETGELLHTSLFDRVSVTAKYKYQSVGSSQCDS